MRKLLVVLLCLGLVGCATIKYGTAVTKYTSFTEIKHPPKSENDTILLLASTKPDRPYVEIGIIKVEKGPRYYSDERDMIKKAREVGADAVIDIKQVLYGTETGTAIVFTDK